MGYELVRVDCLSPTRKRGCERDQEQRCPKNPGSDHCAEADSARGHSDDSFSGRPLGVPAGAAFGETIVGFAAGQVKYL